MRCHDCRTAVSARLDGEDPGRSESEVERHLSGCAACRAFAADAAGLHRAVRLVPAEPMPDLTPAVLAAIGREGRAPERSLGLRVCLVLVALVQITVAAPALVLGDDAGLPVHTARHLGSFAVALAIGFLFVAWRPTRATGLLPVAVALVACVLGASVLDVAAGRAVVPGESGHATEIVGLAITWLLTRPGPVERPVGARA